VIDRAALYFSTPDDMTSAQLTVAHRPLGFRAIVTAVRAGVRAIYVPLALRDTAVGAAVAASTKARSAVVWLKDGELPEAGPLVLVPAAVVVPVDVLRSLAAAAPGAAVAAPAAADAPALTVDAGLAEALGGEIAAGGPLGAELTRLGVRPTVDARVIAARDAAGRVAADRRLHASLGSAIDTRLDVHLHRRFSRHVTRAAIAAGVTPNTITLASFALGLVAVWCLWRASAASALAGLLIYIVAVILDHADGEVARLTLSESRIGEWLDTVADSVVHTLAVVAMGVTSQALTGAGGRLGLVGAAGIMTSALVAKWWPPRGTGGMGGAVEDFGSRDGFYALLLIFIGLRAFAPWALPMLMIVVALGSNAYWVMRAAVAVSGRR
jgi:type IV secretory pathway VirB3-like protein